MDIKNTFDRFKDQGVFIKTTIAHQIDRPQKAALNRKGNVLFNAGDIEGACRIFMTTGYSDGLSRVGDHYKSKGMLMEALRMYWLAKDKRKYEPIMEQLAGLIQNLLREEGDYSNA